MAWPPKIATAKPRDRPKPFDSWWYKMQAKALDDMPMGTEIFYKVCGKDPEKFDLVNHWLEEAFNAGVKQGEKNVSGQ